MNQNPAPISLLTTDALIKLEQELAGYKGPDRIVSAEEMRKELEGQEKRAHSFATGLSRLDDAIGGIESGELIAIGGPTKNGKTLLAQTITANLSAKGTFVTWFSFEVPVHQFLKQVGAAVQFYLPHELKQSDIMWIRHRILEAKLKHNCRIFFIDNLHHLVDFTNIKNVSLDMGIVIRFLKRLAVELNVAIVILCHSRKPEISEAGKLHEVSEWDLRDSSFIPQESDSTIMVQRKLKVDPVTNKATKEFSEQAIIKVCLHRRTGTMGRKIHVRKIGMMLEEDAEYYTKHIA